MIGSRFDSQARKKGDPKPKSAIFFVLLGMVVMALCLPLLYNSMKINALIRQANVKGAVELWDFWMVIFGGIAY